MAHGTTKAAVCVVALAVAASLSHAQSMSSSALPDQTYTISATASGTWSTTYGRPTRSANPVVIAKPHVNAQASPNQTICQPTSVSATTASGFCSVSQATTAALNASIQPFVAAGAIAVDIVVKEPTQ